MRETLKNLQQVTDIFILVAVPWLWIQLARLSRRSRITGEPVIQMPAGGFNRPLAYLFLFCGLVHSIYVGWQFPAVDLHNAAMAALFTTLGYLNLRVSKFVAGPNGIDAGTATFAWSEIRLWYWSQDRKYLEFITDGSAPKQMLHNPAKPYRVRLRYSEQLHQQLMELAGEKADMLPARPSAV